MKNIIQRARKSILYTYMEFGTKILRLPVVTNLADKPDEWGLKDQDLNLLLNKSDTITYDSIVFNEISNKIILVTGAAGSVGSEIVRQILMYDPAKVILCDQAESQLHSLQIEMENSYRGGKIAFYICNIQNEKRMRQIYKNNMPDIVFHAAAYKHVPMMEHNPTEAVLANVLGTKVVADLSAEYNVSKFIMLSTDKAIYPTNVMGASKRIAELYIQLMHRQRCYTKFIITRFGNVLGSSGSAVSLFKYQINCGGPVTVTHPAITRYFMTISEAVELVIKAGATGNGGEIFLSDMGEPVKILDLAHKMIELAGLKQGKDIEVVFTGLRPGEKLYEELVHDQEVNIPTQNPKIKISTASNCCPEDTERLISELLDSVYSSNLEIVKKMKAIVPEYISQNSVYESLDSITEKVAV